MTIVFILLYDCPYSHGEDCYSLHYSIHGVFSSLEELNVEIEYLVKYVNYTKRWFDYREEELRHKGRTEPPKWSI